MTSNKREFAASGWLIQLKLSHSFHGRFILQTLAPAPSPDVINNGDDFDLLN